METSGLWHLEIKTKSSWDDKNAPEQGKNCNNKEKVFDHWKVADKDVVWKLYPEVFRGITRQTMRKQRSFNTTTITRERTNIDQKHKFSLQQHQQTGPEKNDYSTRLSKIRRDLSVASRSIINVRDMNDDILRYRRSIITLLFNHQVCFQLRKAICYFSHITGVWIQLHMSRTICSKSLLDGVTHEQAIICRQLSTSFPESSFPLTSGRKTRALGPIISK